MIISYNNASLGIGKHTLLRDVNVEVDSGDFVYVMGRVGSGKSTLLKSMYGEVDIIDGTAMVLGEDLRRLKASQLPALRRKLGIVFQNFNLLSDFTVAGNLDFVLRAIGWNKKQQREARIAEVLKLVGMDGRGDEMPYLLSGGESQSVCIARALLNSPQIILADEPTGNLDSETATQIVALLHQIARDNGTAVIMSTHNESLMQQFPGKLLRCQDHTIM